jgi:hypothetical protein
MSTTDDPADGATRAWQRHPQAVWRRSSDRIVVLPPDHEDPLLLEGSGQVIWELLAEPIEEARLTDLLAQATSEDPADIGPQIRSFLHELASDQAVEPITGPIPAGTLIPPPDAATRETAARRSSPVDQTDDPTPGDAVELARRIAVYDLPGQPRRVAADPLDPTTWTQVLARVDSQRIPGHLMAAVDDGALPVTDEQRAAVRDAHLDACTQVLRLERRLIDVVDHLETAGIEVVALKGSALAHLAYPDPALRHFGDVDLLVRSEQLEATIARLGELGATREVPELRRGYDRRFAKSVTLTAPDGVEFDVHRNLVFGTFGFRIALDELFRTAVPFTVGGRQLRALGPETRLLHACYHAGLGDPRPRLNSVRDLAQLLLTGDHDPDRVLALAHAWDAEVVLARGIELCRTVLDVEVAGPLAVATSHRRPTSREERAVAAYVGANRSHTAKVLASLPYLDGLGAKAAFVAASALPSRRFVTEDRGTDRRSWLRKGWRSLTRGRT